jgi:hypothetical protein
MALVGLWLSSIAASWAGPCPPFGEGDGIPVTSARAFLSQSDVTTPSSGTSLYRRYSFFIVAASLVSYSTYSALGTQRKIFSYLAFERSFFVIVLFSPLTDLKIC